MCEHCDLFTQQTSEASTDDVGANPSLTLFLNDAEIGFVMGGLVLFADLWAEIGFRQAESGNGLGLVYAAQKHIDVTRFVEAINALIGDERAQEIISSARSERLSYGIV